MLSQRKFTQTGLPRTLSGLLQIKYEGATYDFVVIHAGIEVRPDPSLPPSARPRQRQHRHDAYHILLFVEGDTSVLVDSVRVHCGRGSLLIVDPGVAHEFYFCSQEPASYIEICFALKNDDAALAIPFHRLLSLYLGEEMSLAPVRTDLTEQQVALVYRVLENLLLHLGCGNYAYPTTSSVIEMLMFLAEEVYRVGSGWLSLTESQSVKAVRTELDRRFAERVSLGELADTANLSVSYLCRAFRSAYGLSPMAYQRELRIRAAKNLLLSTDLLCKEIARRTGFEDVYQFSKTFRKLSGVTPTEFRESYRT